MPAPDPEMREAAKVAAIAGAILGVVLTVLARFVFDGRTAMSVAVGAAIAVANLVMLRAIIRVILQPEDAAVDRSPAWGLFAILKIVVLFGVVAVLLTKRLVDPMPLVVGYMVLPLGIVASAVVDTVAPAERRRP